jgi:6-pyruvoyl-tetrahydropterin synthase
MFYLFMSGAYDFQLQFAQANAQTKNCKRASTSPTQERISKYFFQRFKKNKKRNVQPTLNDTETQY